MQKRFNLARQPAQFSTVESLSSIMPAPIRGWECFQRCWEFESTINELVVKLVNNCHESSLKSNRGSWGRKQEVTSTSSHAELIALYKLKQNHYIFCCTCDSFFQEFDETLQCLASLKARLMWKNLPLPTFKFLLLRSKLFLWDLVDGWDRHNQTFKISNHMPT